jgi:hypothetical protein
MIELRTGSINFSKIRGNGPGTKEKFFNFTRPVHQAVAILTGTSFGFSEDDDHHLGSINVRLSTSTDDDVVIVEGTFGVRDWSGSWDDNYEGSIQFTLMAELQDANTLSNLSITGVEYNQATQFFRSELHLDPANIKPDNSIPLIAGKNTVLRVYTDTRTDPSLPTISTISGILEIRGSGTSSWHTILPLNGPIGPIKDFDIRRNNADDTLNFLIAEGFNTGAVQYRVRVFDANHQDLPGFTSGSRRDTLQFVNVKPLNIRGVLVRYTGTDPPLGPPSINDFVTILDFTRQTYPVGHVNITGFDTIDYDGNFTNNSGFEGLLSVLREMQGDSDDVYYGFVTSDVPQGGPIFGLGGGDGRVAASLDLDTLVAHEIAHVFGRGHVPVGAQTFPDYNFPTYNGFYRGSVGEYGIDNSGIVQGHPLSDFMWPVAVQVAWISPYTYLGLKEMFDLETVSYFFRSALRIGNSDAKYLPSPTEHLFLNFQIYRDGKINLSPSFHYPSNPLIKSGRKTPYLIELKDKKDKVLNSQRVYLTDPYKDLDSAVLEFYKPISFHREVSDVIFLYENPHTYETKELLRVKVPYQPPTVEVTYPTKSGELSGKIDVTWRSKFKEKNQLYYLLRYSNNNGKTWRILSPRTQKTKHVVDLDNLPGGKQCLFQVLATEGIRTGSAISDTFRVAVKRRKTKIIYDGPKVVYSDQSVRLFGYSFSPDYGSIEDSKLYWKSNLNGFLGTGNKIMLQRLKIGKHTITLTTQDNDEEKDSFSIEIEVKRRLPKKHTSWTHPGHTSKDHDLGKIHYNGKEVK